MISEFISVLFLAFLAICVYNIGNVKHTPKHKGNVIDFNKAKRKRKK